jgi:hypothetical protein
LPGNGTVNTLLRQQTIESLLGNEEASTVEELLVAVFSV